LEWAQVRGLVADGISEREIARRLGIDRRTVARLARSDEPPRYRRAPTGSQLDPLEPVVRRLLAEWPAIKAPRLTEILRAEYGYTGSVRLVQERLQWLRPSSARPARRCRIRARRRRSCRWT
jgi:transcriptional regulator with XRE-family HTH domain